jgi:DNA-directed RNA polymerase beta' subunit
MGAVFNLLDINKFVKESNARVITTSRTFVKNKDNEMVPNAGSFYDPAIFGFSSKDKFDNFAYLNLDEVVLHPLIYKNLGKAGTDFNKCIQKKNKYIVQDGVLVESKSGGNGINFLINNWNKINFEKYKNEKNKIFVGFLTRTNKNVIIVNKIPILPIAYRNFKTNHGMVEEDEITALYKKLMKVTENKDWMKDLSQEDQDSFDEVLQSIYQKTSKKEYVQKYINELYNYFISKLEKKNGFFQGSLIGKRLDNVARFVINAQPDIPIDCCALPWQGLLNIFDLFVISYLTKEENEKVAEELGIKNATADEIGELLYYIYKNAGIYADSYPEKVKIWIDTLVKIFNDNPELRVLAKRDPGWSYHSFWAFKPIIISDVSYQMIVPAFVYAPIGGDSFRTDSFLTQVKSEYIDINTDYSIKNPRKTVNKFISSEQLHESLKHQRGEK